MQLFVTILHIFLCVCLILIILLQPGKEGAAAFGGSGGNQMYGPRGQGHLLGRATTVVAAMFMFTSITLALYSGSRVSTDSDLERGIQALPGLDDEGGFKIDLPDAPPAEAPAVPAIDPFQPAEGASGALEGLMGPAPSEAPTTVLPDAPVEGAAAPQ